MPKAPTGILSRVELFLYHLYKSLTPETVLVIIVILAAAVRFTPVVSSSFPVNDGGYLYSMIADIQNNHFLLPRFASYNQAQIPFTYPPLALYLAAFLSQSGIPLLAILRFLPPFVSVTTVLLVYHFACLFCKSRTAGLITTFAFAVVPISYTMLVMGGGLTRSFGLLFFLTSLIFAYHYFTRPSFRRLFLVSAAFSLSVLSHPEWTLTTFVSLIVLGFYLSPPRLRIRSVLSVFLFTLVICSPWITLLLARFGFSPVISAFGSGFWNGYVLLPFQPFIYTHEPSLPLFAVAGLFSAAYLILRGYFFLPLWIFISYVTNPRTSGQSNLVPLSLAVGLVFSKYFLKRLRPSPPFPYLKTSLALAVLLLPYLSVSLFNYTSQLTSLTRDTVSAMEWVRGQTPPDARFLVLSPNTFVLWSYDKTAEWFPALTGKISLTTAQGLEWLPNQRFNSLLYALNSLQPCISPGLNCLESWAGSHRLDYTHIFISDPQSACCSLFTNQLNSSPAYTRIFQNHDVIIWARKPPLPDPRTPSATPPP
jgi:hypothetical protein